MRPIRTIVLALAVTAAALSAACSAGGGRPAGAERATTAGPDFDLGREPRNASPYRRP